jgi:hypothetical protein
MKNFKDMWEDAAANSVGNDGVDMPADVQHDKKRKKKSVYDGRTKEGRKFVEKMLARRKAKEINASKQNAASVSMKEETIDEALSPSYKNKYVGKDKASLQKSRNSFLSQIDDLIKFKKKTTKDPEVVQLQDLLKQVDYALKGVKKESVEEGKYQKYSDLLIKKAKLVAQGPIASKEVADINKQIAAEMKNLGVKEAVEAEAYYADKNKKTKETLKKHDKAMIKVARDSIKKYQDKKDTKEAKKPVSKMTPAEKAADAKRRKEYNAYQKSKR